ncbi:hypothetical protein Sjap_020004 [Stephania japonica]|uniref:BHLH domain-containing protein n=1 Tax=Stephania japonica TaxID=461633 RepID=A0AAP0I032_9MAGN
MNRGALQSLPAPQQMMAGNPNWWNINSNMRAPSMASSSSTQQQHTSSHPNFLPSPSSMLNIPHHHYFSHAPSNSLSLPQLNTTTTTTPTWHDSSSQELPESWSQLLLGGLVGEEDRSGPSHFHGKKLENWDDQVLYPSPGSHGDVKQEASEGAYMFCHGNQELQPTARPNWSHVTPANSSTTKSCLTSFGNNNMLDFSNNKKIDGGSNSPSTDLSSECNSSSATGGALKKARVQPSSTQTTFKVRKEKLGDRITALHQLVSPFGKTDTASVLLEAIGYIRFLQSQIEALSSPYLGSASGNMRQQSVQGEKNCIFPEDPGQLLNDNCMKRRGSVPDKLEIHEPKTDLRSRGLCLVPVSCTVQVGSDNGADFWAPSLGGGFR